jgi:hypothetical protein
VDFTIHYDELVLTFLEAKKDTGLPNWESFYVSHDSVAHTVGVTSIADIVNGPIHPKPEDFYPNGPAAGFRFLVAEDWTTDSALTSLSFRWRGCQSNAVSNRWGDSLIVIQVLKDYIGNLIWDEEDDLNYPDSARPDSVGVPDSCLEGTSDIFFLIEFRNGIIANYLVCGDTDANSVVNISDIVFLLSYIFGHGSAPDPLETADVDCNEVVNVSDCVYLITYVFGGGPAPCSGCP